MPRPEGLPKTGGRQKGTPNNASVERQAEVAAGGQTPLQFMLKMMRDEKADKEDRKWAAQNAAHYVHPKLQNLKVHGAPEGELPPVRFKIEVIGGNGTLQGQPSAGD